MPEPVMVNITINGVPLKVAKGERVIDSARRADIDIPFFCYHPRLSMESGANCRMCLVEVSMPRRNPDGTVVLAKMPKLQTACSLPADEGMVVATETEQVVQARKGVLEFLLINHPLDCPICDRGGECPLQNNTLHYGPPTTRFVEEKRHYPKAYPLSKYVVFDRERCIQCARCTRFTSDISGDSQLGFLKRGADTEVATFDQAPFDSRYSGNTIEICPVGALTSRTYRFGARPWDLATQYAVCTECSNGCNVKLDHRAGKVLRVNARTNEAVNEEWTCDRGKFGMVERLGCDRIAEPLLRNGDRFEPVSWDAALSVLTEMLNKAGADAAALGGAHSTNEDLYVLQQLFRAGLGSSSLDHRMGPHLATGVGVRGGRREMPSPIASLDTAGAFLLVASNLLDEQPMLFLRVRKAWKSGAKVVLIAPEGMGDIPAQLAEIVTVLLRPADADVPAFVARLTSALAGPEDSELVAAASLLKSGRTVGIAGEWVAGAADPASCLSATADLLAAAGSPGALNFPAREVNARGAQELGILPDRLPGGVAAGGCGRDTRAIIGGLHDGSVKALLVLEADPAAAYARPESAAAALGMAPFVAYVGTQWCSTARMADLVLPALSVAERDGTFTSGEGRVQRFRRAFEGPTGCRAPWAVFAEVSARLGHRLPYMSARDVLSAIAADVPAYAGCRPRELGDQGVLLTGQSGGEGA